MDSDGEVPEGRCGFVLEPGDIPGDFAEVYEAGTDRWYEASDAVCCWREVWDGGDGDRCIWHADTEDKSADALLDARADRPERLDGAYVPPVDLGDAIDFVGCVVQATTFDGTELREASFAGVYGRFSKFPYANLRQAQFPHANLHQAQFPHANLYLAQFPNADLRGAQFPHANLSWSEFPHANLRGAEFPDADLRNAEFTDTVLLRAKFPNANLLGAKFSGALLWKPQQPNASKLWDEGMFPDATLNGTNFEDAYMNLQNVAELTDQFDATTVFGWSHYELEDFSWDAAARAYREFQQTLREHAMPAAIRRYRIREMHMRRKVAFLDSPFEWAKLALARWTTLYGESPYRVVATSLVLIIGWALLYPVPGIRASGTELTYPSLLGDLPGSLVTLLGVLAESVYFSTVTFTTLGYGDVQPVGWAKGLATVESFVGALLMALLVAVLARRVTW